MCLLAAEMMAVEQASPSELYERLAERLGRPVYQRLDAPRTTMCAPLWPLSGRRMCPCAAWADRP